MLLEITVVEAHTLLAAIATRRKEVVEASWMGEERSMTLAELDRVAHRIRENLDARAL